MPFKQPLPLQSWYHWLHFTGKQAQKVEKFASAGNEWDGAAVSMGSWWPSTAFSEQEMFSWVILPNCNLPVMILLKDHFARNESNALFTGGSWESEIKTVEWDGGQRSMSEIWSHHCFQLSLEKFAGTETAEANTGRSWVWSRKNRAKAQRGNQDSWRGLTGSLATHTKKTLDCKEERGNANRLDLAIACCMHV